MLTIVLKVSMGLAFLSSVHWVYYELRSRLRYTTLRKQTEAEGAAMVEDRINITDLPVVRDVYGMQ